MTPREVPGPQALLDRLEAPLRDALWRGDHLADLSGGVQPSGHAALDAELPGGGWPRGMLTELLCSGPGIGEWRLLAPALSALATAGREVLCIAPPHWPHGPALAALGLPLTRLLWVQVGRGPARADAGAPGGLPGQGEGRAPQSLPPGGEARAEASPASCASPAATAAPCSAAASTSTSAAAVSASSASATAASSASRTALRPRTRPPAIPVATPGVPAVTASRTPAIKPPPARPLARSVPATTLADAAWAAEQALKSRACGAVLWWVPVAAGPGRGERQGDALRPDVLRRLHLAAQGSDSLLFLLRPLAAARQSSPAPLRLACRPLKGAASGDLEIEVLKRRGPVCAQPVPLPLSAQLPAALRQGLRRRQRGLQPAAAASPCASASASAPAPAPQAVPARAALAVAAEAGPTPGVHPPAAQSGVLVAVPVPIHSMEAADALAGPAPAPAVAGCPRSLA